MSENLMRITHRKDLLHDIVTFYADKRGWDAAVCCRIVEWMLHRFEQKRARKYRLKRYLKVSVYEFGKSHYSCLSE